MCKLKYLGYPGTKELLYKLSVTFEVHNNSHRSKVFLKVLQNSSNLCTSLLRSCCFIYHFLYIISFFFFCWFTHFLLNLSCVWLRSVSLHMEERERYVQAIHLIHKSDLLVNRGSFWSLLPTGEGGKIHWNNQWFFWWEKSRKGVGKDTENRSLCSVKQMLTPEYR